MKTKKDLVLEEMDTATTKTKHIKDWFVINHICKWIPENQYFLLLHTIEKSGVDSTSIYRIEQHSCIKAPQS
jgi:hypothetical protein